MSAENIPVKATRVVIVDDHQLFMDGIVTILNKISEFEIIGEALNGNEALEIIKDKQPDLVIVGY